MSESRQVQKLLLRLPKLRFQKKLYQNFKKYEMFYYRMLCYESTFSKSKVCNLIVSKVG